MGEGEEAVRQAVRPGGHESFGIPPKHIHDKGGYWLMQVDCRPLPTRVTPYFPPRSFQLCVPISAV